MQQFHSLRPPQNMPAAQKMFHQSVIIINIMGAT